MQASSPVTQHYSLGQRLKRALRHWRTTTGSGRKAFPRATLKAIADSIAAGELRHRAEVRLVVEASLDLDTVFADVSVRARALALFAEYGIWDTEDNCGVLIYVNLADRKVEIVADRNVDRLIEASQWHAICRTMTAGFSSGNYHDSTIAAIGILNDLLAQHFPAQGARPNQLPNDAIIR